MIILLIALLLAISKVREMRVEQEQVLEKARKKADQILESAEVSADKVRKLVETRLERVLQNVSKSIESSALKEVEDFKGAMQLETVRTQRAVAEKLETEIAEIKRQKLARLDEQVAAVLENVSREVLGKALHVSEHRDLVMKALEEAKKQHVL